MTFGPCVRCFLIALLISGVPFAVRGEEAAPQTGDEGTPTEYQLVWADEFDVDGPPNPANWGYEQGFARNEELQWYQAENAACHDGLLVIEARREQVANPAFDPQSRRWQSSREHAEYTSASLLTRGKHEWTYGRFEIRARIDARKGLWPAIWTLGSARSWPGCGEIDVMEYYDDTILANACWQGRWRTEWDNSRTPLKEFGPTWAEDFHVWVLDWTPERLRISVDDRLLNEVPLETAVNTDRQHSEPFQEPHYMLLNLAIGGTRGGDPSKTEFPAKFEVDYVRVYQRDGDGK
ncbi:MAG: glycoside hydrolase family 16 protein [Planctomycetales bacterium]|nr:glycoside hydrolase family 16 protein [Planctomycetales bacterium]